jgi:hypothetical protein
MSQKTCNINNHTQTNVFFLSVTYTHTHSLSLCPVSNVVSILLFRLLLLLLVFLRFLCSFPECVFVFQQNTNAKILNGSLTNWTKLARNSYSNTTSTNRTEKIGIPCELNPFLSSSRKFVALLTTNSSKRKIENVSF